MSAPLPGAVEQAPGAPAILCVIPCSPDIDTSVLEVDLQRRAVILAAGLNAGVKQGFIFDLYRGSTYKGQVRVTLVEEERSKGTILHIRAAIEPGDSATNHL